MEDKPADCCTDCGDPLDAKARANYDLVLKRWCANRKPPGPLCTECDERRVRQGAGGSIHDAKQKRPGWQMRRYDGNYDDPR